MDTNYSKQKPLIGIAPAYFPKENSYWHMVKEAYSQSIWSAAGIPVILTYPNSTDDIHIIAEQIDGLVLSGGPDLPIETYGGKSYDLNGEDPMHTTRVNFDKDIFKACVSLNKPILAICAGIQQINVIYGGTLYEDIETQLSGAINHGNYKGHIENHRITVEPESLLFDILNEKNPNVTCTHHQGIKTLGEGLRAVARTADGLIEAIEPSNGQANYIGVQWHPELMQDDPIQKRLFQWLIRVSKLN